MRVNRLGFAVNGGTMARMARTMVRIWRDLWCARTGLGSRVFVPPLCFARLPYEVLMQAIITIFFTVFFAELGDKTQLATVLFATDKQLSPWLIFLAAAGALVASTAIAVALGTMAERYLTMIPLKLIAGIGFIAIGAWTVWGHFQA